MTAYSKTWDVDALSYNAFTKRALDKIEDNAALMWQSKTDNTWATHTDRAFNTVYTNNSDSALLVIATVHLVSSSDLLNNGTQAVAAFEVQEAGEGSFTELYFVRQDVANAGGPDFDDRLVMYGIVNPGGQYRIVPTTGSRSSATLDRITEFYFDAAYVPQAAAHGEHLSDITWWDTYSAGVNNLADPAGDFTSSAAPTTADTPHTVGDVVRFISITGGSATLQVADDGGTLTEVCQTSRSGGTITGHIKQRAMFVNPGGSWQSGDTNSGSEQVDFPVLANEILFVSGQSGVVNVGDKFRDLDDKAASGINRTKLWTRTNHGTQDDSQIVIPAGPPAIFLFQISLTSSNPTAEIIPSKGTRVYIEEPTSGSERSPFHVCIMGVVEGGGTIDITVGSELIVHQRWTWQMRDG